MSLIIQQMHRTLIQEGSYIARCFAVVDLGIQNSKTCNVHFPKIMLGWELKKSSQDTEKPYIHWQSYIASLGIYARLRLLIEDWRGTGITKEELSCFSVSSLLGMPCHLTIKHRSTADPHMNWATVQKISPLPQDIPCPELQHKFIHFDLDHYTEEDYQSVPEPIRKKINFEE